MNLLAILLGIGLLGGATAQIDAVQSLPAGWCAQAGGVYTRPGLFTKAHCTPKSRPTASNSDSHSPRLSTTTINELPTGLVVSGQVGTTTIIQVENSPFY